MARRAWIAGLAVFFFIFIFLSPAVLAQTTQDKAAATAESTTKSAPAKGEEETKVPLVTDTEKIKELEQKEVKALEEIEEKKEDIEEAAEEIAEVAEEKLEKEKDAALKQQAATVAKEKLEDVKQKAETTGGAGIQQEVEKLEKEAAILQEEAETAKEELKLVEIKEEKAAKMIAANEQRIEDLRKALGEIEKEKVAKVGLIEKGLRSVVILVIGVILFILLKIGVKKFEGMLTRKDVLREDEKTLRMKTMAKLFNWLGGIVIIIMILYLLLSLYGFNVGPLIAGAGIMGLAFGFGGQYLIRDLINGLFILIEGQYRINDVVKIGEYGGLVEDINLRITVLRDLAGRVIIVPNGEVKTVVNYTKEYAQALLDIGVAYKENVDRVIEVIKEVGAGMRKDQHFGRLILADLEMLGVDDFADSAVMIKFRIKTLPIRQWEVSREFRRRLKNRFDELGIEIPFPHRTLYMGTGPDNDWVRGFASRVAPPGTGQ